MSIDSNSTSPSSPILRFFLTSFLLLVIGYSQYIIKKVFSTWFPTSIQSFTDLCSVANISIFILDQSLHGYYLHGVSPTGMADGSVEDLRRALALEASGKARPRGIQPERDPELQCYEIYIPWKMRQTYDNVSPMQMSTGPVEEEINAYNTAKRMGQASRINLNLYASSLPQELDYERLEYVRAELNHRFKTYISTVIMDARTHILDKTPLQRFLHMPPTDLAVLEGSPFFYRDPDMHWENVFVMGHEFTFLLMDLLVFAAVDLAAGDTLLSAFITYIWDKVIMWFRADLGEKNLSKKTLVDERFLI